MKKIICEGNGCKYSTYASNGCADYSVTVTDIGEDDCMVIYEDGLYKLIKNGVMIRAATQVHIRFVDFTNR